MAALTSLVRFCVPFLAPCLPCPTSQGVECPSPSELGTYKRFSCPPGHYNDLAGLLFTSNDDAVKHLFNCGTPQAYT